MVCRAVISIAELYHVFYIGLVTQVISLFDVYPKEAAGGRFCRWETSVRILLDKAFIL